MKSPELHKFGAEKAKQLLKNVKIAIAILTWNRLPALKQIIDGLSEHCSQHKIAVFEDAGTKDGTSAFVLDQSTSAPKYRHEYDATQVKSLGADVFLGNNNLGVSGNTNRALRWFVEESGCDYLCLCNDDLVVKGDFASYYASAWQKFHVGLWCFCGFTSKMYAYDEVPVDNYTVKVLGRMTGAMMAMPKELIERIGYFDMRFGKFGEEHVDFTNRARLAGYQQFNGKPCHCLDVKHSMLEHLEVESTMVGAIKAEANAAANEGVKTLDYAADGFYRPYRLVGKNKVGGVDGEGINDAVLGGYYNVTLKQEVPH